MLTAQIRCLQDPGWLSKLHSSHYDFPELARAAQASSCRISNSMRWMQTEIREGYPLFFGFGREVLVLLVACVTVDGHFGVLAHPCDRVRGDPFSSDWNVHPATFHRALAPTERVEVARNWRLPKALCLTALH